MVIDKNKFELLKKKKDKYIEIGKMTYPYIKEIKGEEKFEQAAYFIANAKTIAIITGAGLSTDSGVPDFRSSDGVYSMVPEEIFSAKHFYENPNGLYNVLLNVFNKRYKPNKIHELLADLETEKEIIILTQNIDNLNFLSSNVIEMHGTIKTGTCVNCGAKYEFLWGNVSLSDFKCDECVNNNFIKPDIVLYGEDVCNLDEAILAIKKADLVLVLGSSMKVYPVCDLPSYAKPETPIIIINRDKTPLNDNRMALEFEGDILKTLNKILGMLQK